jgi:diacylglycerol O-acyltransferase / wax synthase
MAAEHKSTLSVLDNSFLELESGSTHMHVGGLAIFDGPPLDCDALHAHLQSRLHLVPRYRQKLTAPGFELGRPMWIDDPCFTLDYHVRHTALPRPGGEAQLQKLCARVFSQQLDRAKPLWEMWLVEGVEDGRFAILTKTHHALIDGMSGVDLMSTLFDLTPEPREVDPPERPWQPHPAPSGVEVAAGAAAEVATRPWRVARRAVEAALHPQRTAGEVVEGALGVRDLLLKSLLSPAPSTPLNQPTTPHRRVTWCRFDLADFKGVKNELGGTVNDVVLAVVAGGVRTWLKARGVRTDGLELRAMVPVSVRTEDQRNTMGNQVAAMRGPLPVWADHPVERLRAVQQAMQGLKQSHQAVGAEVLAGVQEFAPPTLLHQAARLNFHPRLFNTIVTNVPGPQLPLYLLGRELQEVIPLGFLPEGHTVFFAIMSYNGRLDIGLLADREAMPDVEVLAEGLRDALAELVSAAGVRTGRDGGGGGGARKRAAAATGANGRAG